MKQRNDNSNKMTESSRTKSFREARGYLLQSLESLPLDDKNERKVSIPSVGKNTNEPLKYELDQSIDNFSWAKLFTAQEKQVLEYMLTKCEDTKIIQQVTKQISSTHPEMFHLPSPPNSFVNQESSNDKPQSATMRRNSSLQRAMFRAHELKMTQVQSSSSSIFSRGQSHPSSLSVIGPNDNDVEDNNSNLMNEKLEGVEQDNHPKQPNISFTVDGSTQHTENIPQKVFQKKNLANENNIESSLSLHEMVIKTEKESNLSELTMTTKGHLDQSSKKKECSSATPPSEHNVPFHEKQNKDTNNSHFSPKRHPQKPHDAWNVFQDKDCLGYGYGGDKSIENQKNANSHCNANEPLPFKILGTSAEDSSCHPHVLSPPLMESLQSFINIMEEPVAETIKTIGKSNFFLKYSLIRDGPSLLELLKRVRGCTHTVLAIETLEGVVFGCYTTEPWRPTWGYYGTNHDKNAFVWRMRRSRLTPCESLLEQAKMESELEVYPYTGTNELVQLCRRDKIGIGGGGEITDIHANGFAINTRDGEKENIRKNEAGSPPSSKNSDRNYGFSISLGSNLTYGSTSASDTFGSPCLVDVDAEGSRIQIGNLEVWSITPRETVHEAEQDELYHLFFNNTSGSSSTGSDDKHDSQQNLSLFQIFMNRS